MEPDEEGFLYPKINIEKCIQCRLCESVYSMINLVKEESIPQQGFLVQHRNEAIRLDGLSGGALTAIASTVIDKGGVVFGAAYDDLF